MGAGSVRARPGGPHAPAVGIGCGNMNDPIQQSGAQGLVMILLAHNRRTAGVRVQERLGKSTLTDNAEVVDQGLRRIRTEMLQGCGVV